MLGAVISLILALQYGGVTKAWKSSTVIGLLVGFVLMITAFVILAWKQGERSMLVPRLMRDRNVWVNAVYGGFFAGSYFVPLYYLPIYFQSIDNVGPANSGVRIIPLIIAFTIATILSGGSITKTGVATPLMVFGAVVATIAAGLLYTLDIGTGAGKWIGYQVLAGFGYGIGFQVPIIVGQATSAPADISSVTATILCKSYISHSPISYHASSAAYRRLIFILNLQSSKLRVAHSSSQLHNPASSTDSSTSCQVPHQASVPRLLWQQAPLSCAVFGPALTWTVFSLHTWRVSKSLLQSRLQPQAFLFQ